MTETSGFWTTSGTPSGHQVANYTQAIWSVAAEILAACSGFEGVAPGYLNELACSDGGANTVDVATGGGVTDGKWHKSDAVENVNIPSAAGGGNTRIDRVVIRVSWAAFTAEIHRIAGTDAGSPTAPAITQTSGTTYDIMLCQALVNTGGDITVTDERDWGMVEVDDSTIENNTGQLRVKDEGITAAKIDNRTRNKYLAAGELMSSDATELVVAAQYSVWSMADAATQRVYGTLAIPEGYASGNATLKLYWSSPAASGNGYLQLETRSKADSEAVGGADDLDTGLAAFSTSGANLLNIDTLSAAVPVAAGEFLFFTITRSGAHGSDTLNDALYVHGVEIEYTADS